MNNILNFLPLILLFIATYAYYIIFAINLSTSAKFLQMRRYAVASIIALLPLYLSNTQLTPYIFPTHILVALAFMLSERTIAYVATKDSTASLNMPFPIAFSLYSFAGFLSLHIILLNLFSYHTAINLFMTFIQTFLLFLAAIHLIYFLLFKTVINTNTFMLIYQTDKSEAKEYLHSLGYKFWLTFISTLSFIIYSLYYGNMYTQTNMPKLLSSQLYFLSFLTIVTIFYSFKKLFPKCVLVSSWEQVSSYYKYLSTYKNNRQNILSNLVATNTSTSTNNIIFVIGESASRDYMSAFTPLEENTTPWLNANTNSPNFHLFPNAYACASSTVPALSHALTNANYYNDIPFNDAVSIIDIAKKAGFKTYWFSNQAKVGMYDTPITMIAEAADTALWAQDTYPDEKPFDEVLLRFLPSVASDGKNLIVLHLMGSHIDYNNRYPNNFQKWTDKNETGRVADFKNSLLYTDFILEQVYNFFEKQNTLDALIYCSDHGSNPARKRHPDGSGFSGLRIPLFVYLSEKYQSQNSDLSKTLKNNCQNFWTNDLTFSLICSILNIKSNYVNPEESLASTHYKFNRDNLVTSEGTLPLTKDPFYPQ